MYGADGRLLVLITYDGRPKPPPTDKMTDKDRAEQYAMMNAYGGTYTFHGDRIEHHIDISFNERNVGNNVVRDIRREGDRLVYTTKPQPFSGDGKMSVVTLVWEKVKQ